MEEKNESSILSDRAQKTAAKVKEYFTRRPVGGQIRDEKYGDWDEFKQRSKEYKLPITPDGMELMVWVNNEVTGALYPIAKASGLELVPFVKDRVRKFLEPIKNNKDWIKETDNLHNNIIKETDKNLAIQIKKK